MVELDNAYFLFDYYTGQIPKLDLEKILHVFVSHAHQDHYNRDIWKMRKTFPKVMFVVSKDIPLSASQKNKLGLTELDEQTIVRVKADERHQLFTYPWQDYARSFSITIETLLSTDEGVAFIVNYDDKCIFHSGDLNLWTWIGDEDETNRDRLRRFMLEMEKIKGRIFDVAFFPLDPRQEEACGDGFRIFQQMTETKNLFPMHMWGDYTVIQAYIEKYPDNNENILKIDYEGQTFEID